MKISYDPEIDALYIRLLDGEHECRTVRLSGTPRMSKSGRTSLGQTNTTHIDFVFGVW